MEQSQNPYASGLAPHPKIRRSSTGVLKWLLIAMTVYYVFSFLTLPFADEFWTGEVPLFAIPQLPKSWFYTRVRRWMVEKAFEWGIDKGSASPTMIAAKPWAFAVLFVFPPLLMTTIVTLGRGLKKYRRWVFLMIAAAVIDALVSLWFDKTSSLSIF